MAAAGAAMVRTAAMAIALALLIPARRVSATPAPPFHTREIAEGVFVHIGRQVALDAPGHDDIANVGYVVGTRCVAVVDTGGSLKVGRALRAEIRERTPLPICYVVNTHDHVDHVLGDAAFLADTPRFVGHSHLKPAMLRNRDFFLKSYGSDFDQPPSQDQVIVPDLAVAEDLELDLGGRRLTLRAWPDAHTDSDLTVLDQKTGTLWAGDLLFRDRLPSLDGDLLGWLAALRELEGMRMRLCIPGHGAAGTDVKTLIASDRRYLTALADGVRAELRGGQSMQHAIDHVAESERSRWLLWPETHPHNVARAYQQLEWE